MSLKTEYGFNEDDFAQNGESMNELTVTITLCEYRNLIREQAQAAKEIELLQERLKKAQESGKAFMELLFLKSPEIVSKICDLYTEFFPSGKTEDGESDVLSGTENDERERERK